LFGPGAAPFLGYFILIEDDVGSRETVTTRSPHFPTDPGFQGASYQRRMHLMCERMVQHQLYASASVLCAPKSSTTGDFTNLSARTSFRQLLTRLASYLASETEVEKIADTVNEAQAPYGESGLLNDECYDSEE